MRVLNDSSKTNFVAGQWVSSSSIIRSLNPSDTSDVIGEFAAADSAQVSAAVEAAEHGFLEWSNTPIQKRFDVLDAVGTELAARVDELGALIAREEGKTIRDGIAEARRAAYIFKFAAGEVLRNSAENVQSVRPGLEVQVSREPLGVVGIITPWNFPLAIPAWKIAPALAAGCSIVFKPASYVPACAVALVQILERNGVPPGVINLVVGRGATVGDVLALDPRVCGISFTGSIEVGRSLGERCVARGARVQLEMGGKNPLVVLDDANLKLAIDVAVDGSFYQAGQRCTASSRLIVTDKIYDEFVNGMCDRMKGLAIGNALHLDTDIGPLIDSTARESVLGFVDRAVTQGAEIVAGGKALFRATDGHYMEPTLLLNTTGQMEINQLEVFGPVATVLRVKDYEEALAEANNSRFGLSAGICTQSLRYASDFRRRATTGLVMVNVPTAGLDYHVPFGGRKESSFGPREQGTYGRDFYSIVKTSYVRAEVS